MSEFSQGFQETVEPSLRAMGWLVGTFLPWVALLVVVVCVIGFCVAVAGKDS